jgi:hypothetical protein
MFSHPSVALWSRLGTPGHPGHGAICLLTLSTPAHAWPAWPGCLGLATCTQGWYVPWSRGQVPSMLTSLLAHAYSCPWDDHLCSSDFDFCDNVKRGSAEPARSVRTRVPQSFSGTAARAFSLNIDFGGVEISEIKSHSIKDRGGSWRKSRIWSPSSSTP